MSEVRAREEPGRRAARGRTPDPWVWAASRPWWVQVLRSTRRRGSSPRSCSCGWPASRSRTAGPPRAPTTSRSSGASSTPAGTGRSPRTATPPSCPAATTAWSSRTRGRSSRCSRCSCARSCGSRGAVGGRRPRCWPSCWVPARCSSSTGPSSGGAPRAVAARPGLPLATVALVSVFPTAAVLQIGVHRVARAAARRDRAAAAAAPGLLVDGARRRRARVHARRRPADGRGGRGARRGALVVARGAATTVVTWRTGVGSAALAGVRRRRASRGRDLRLGDGGAGRVPADAGGVARRPGGRAVQRLDVRAPVLVRRLGALARGRSWASRSSSPCSSCPPPGGWATSCTRGRPRTSSTSPPSSSPAAAWPASCCSPSRWARSPRGW